MAILNFGSLNIDHVYTVDHFVRPGETLSSTSYRQFSGGKGFNQSIALAYAGAQVSHAGKLGEDGRWLKERLAGAGADTAFVDIVDGPSGHAIIQVSRDGENAIILHGGANQQVTEADAERILPNFSSGDYLLLQNEISAMPTIMRQGDAQGLRIVFNPAPMHRDVLSYPLQTVDVFIVNEVEGGELTGEAEAERILTAMGKRFPQAATVLTLGANGAIYADRERRLAVPAAPVTPVDTTAAGDTFTGYFLAEMAAGQDVEMALRTAAKAAALCVTRPGASNSIPRRHELAEM